MWLIVGGDSAIGAIAAQVMRDEGDEVIVTSRRGTEGALTLDLARPLNEWFPPSEVSSACICAAASGIAQCATDPAGTALVNIAGTGTLVERLIGRRVHVVFLSTNQVFDGTRPLVPVTARRCPVSEYGRQKAEIEGLLEKAIGLGAPICVLRLTKVIVPGAPLLTGWARSLARREPVMAFNDMYVAPVPAHLVALTIRCLMREQETGFYQLSGPRDVSYVDVARIMATRLGVPQDLVLEETAVAAGLPEGALPRYTSLESGTLRDRCGIEVPDVTTLVDRFVDDLEPQDAS